MAKRSASRLRIEALRVRELCEARNWSAEDLSHAAWTSPEIARNVFYGRTIDPSVSSAIPIARALGTYVEDLVKLTPEATLPGKEIERPSRTPELRFGTFKIKRLKVRERCDELGWTADDLARFSGVNFSTARGIYYGYTADPTLSTMIPIARSLEKHVEELVEAEETEVDIQTPLSSELIAA